MLQPFRKTLQKPVVLRQAASGYVYRVSTEMIFCNGLSN